MQTEILTITGQRRIELVATELPAPGEGQVLIAGGYIGLCRGDSQSFTGAVPVTYPAKFGHEPSGTVAEVGPGVTSVRVGDRVATWPTEPGLGRHWLAEQRYCFPLPGDVSLRTGANVEAGMCSFEAVDRPVGDFPSGLRTGEDVVVIGAAPMSFGVVQAAVLRAPRSLTVVARRQEPLELARQLGAHTVDVSWQDLHAEVMKATEGRGASVIYESTGVQWGIDTAGSLIDFRTRLHQRIVVVGYHQTDGGDRTWREQWEDVCGTPTFRAHFRDADDRITEGMRAVVSLLDRGLLTPEVWAGETYDIEDCQAALEAASDEDSPEKHLKVTIRV